MMNFHLETLFESLFSFEIIKEFLSNNLSEMKTIVNIQSELLMSLIIKASKANSKLNYEGEIFSCSILCESSEARNRNLFCHIS